MRIAINGFGRIGRAVFRILDGLENIEIVAINDLFEPEIFRYLTSYDTIMGNFSGCVDIEDGHLITANTRSKMLCERDPALLPWKQLEVDVVIESTGIFRSRAGASQHLTAGSKRVLLTVPSTDAIDFTLVLGANENGLKSEHKIISNASCTTNCLAPLIKIFHESFGLKEGVINTVHAYTNDQSLADVPHTDWRRSRAAAENIIPTSTGAAIAVGDVLPELKGRLHGMATRVPVLNGSVVDLFAELESEVAAEEINAAIQIASDRDGLRGIIEYSQTPIVSSDIIGNLHSSIFDSLFTQTRGKYIKILSWYDNEWGYSNRICDALKLISLLD